jgi:hypothetical protein
VLMGEKGREPQRNLDSPQTLSQGVRPDRKAQSRVESQALARAARTELVLRPRVVQTERAPER